MSPPPDYKIPLFPRGYSRYVRSLSIRVRALYPLKWLLNGGYSEIKNAYRGLEMLNVVFEMEDATKGLCKVLGKKEDEQWDAYSECHLLMLVDGLACTNKASTQHPASTALSQKKSSPPRNLCIHSPAGLSFACSSPASSTTTTLNPPPTISTSTSDPAMRVPLMLPRNV